MAESDQKVIMASFVKMLTEGDANRQLTVPRSIIPHVNGGDGGELRAMDDHTGIFYMFCLSINYNSNVCRSSSSSGDPYDEVVFQSQGWLQFVKDKRLQVGDSVYFWQDEEGVFRIEALHIN